MKFAREELAAICYKECPDAEILEENCVSNGLPSMWSKEEPHSVYRIMIFRYGDKFYRGTYIVCDSNEIEENLNADEIECPEVEQKEVMVKQWAVKE